MTTQPSKSGPCWWIGYEIRFANRIQKYEMFDARFSTFELNLSDKCYEFVIRYWSRLTSWYSTSVQPIEFDWSDVLAYKSFSLLSHAHTKIHTHTLLSFRLGVTLLLVRQARTRSTNNAATISSNGSDRGKSLWDHCCGKSAAIRTHASKQPTRLPTMTRLALVCVDLNSKRKAWVAGARRGVFCATRSCVLIQNIHTHTHTHTNHPRCLSASECCTRATPLNHVYGR